MVIQIAPRPGQRIAGLQDYPVLAMGPLLQLPNEIDANDAGTIEA
jgi:hypothetical protein